MICIETDYFTCFRLPSPAMIRSEGLCPLTPEETVLMLAALGFNRKTHIYVAGAQIYGGTARLAALMSLYPNLVTKENLLSSKELEPFMNFSSQVTLHFLFILVESLGFVIFTLMSWFLVSWFLLRFEFSELFWY